MKKIIILSGVFFVTMILNGCSDQDKPKNFDYGHVENGKYVNSYFNFEITLPTGWFVQTKEQMDEMTNSGQDLIAGDDSKMKAVFEASKVNVANLLSVFQFEQGAPVEYNPCFSLVAENIKKFPGIKTGSDYLFQTRKILEQSQIKYDHIDKEFSKEVINGTDFYKMNAEIEYTGLNIKQIYYSAIIKGFSFNLIISYINDQQEQDLLKAVNSMKFK
jgi:hypothetical protein